MLDCFLCSCFCYIFDSVNCIFSSPCLPPLPSYVDASWLLLGGWGINYLPFFAMGRRLFLHHYLPALLFLVCAAAALVEHVFVDWLESRRGLACAVLVLTAASAAIFVALSPMTCVAGQKGVVCLASKCC